MPTKLLSREIRLAERPTGLPGAAAFAFATAEVSEPADGEVLIRNRWLSVEPYMLERMNGQVAYTTAVRRRGHDGRRRGR